MNSDIDNDFYILKIIRTEGVTPKIFHNLINIFKTPKKALDYLSDFLKQNNKNISIFSDELAEKEIIQIKKFGAKIINCLSPDYPFALKLAFDHPPILICYGNINLFKKDIISVVGSRNASIMGLKFTTQISQQISEFGFAVMSGFARGIDSSAHQATLDSTIAVMPGGLDYIYPEENELLYKQIGEKGLMISEKPLYTKPTTIDFKTRNRIVAGSALATCVMEATLKSGSLLTARLALEYHREVLATPGSPLDPRSTGTNKLISEGAHMLTCIDDIISVVSSNTLLRKEKELAVKENVIQSPIDPAFITNEIRINVVRVLSENPISIEDLHLYFKFDIRYLHLILLELELLNKIKRHKGNKFSLNK